MTGAPLYGGRRALRWSSLDTPSGLEEIPTARTVASSQYSNGVSLPSVHGPGTVGRGAAIRASHASSGDDSRYCRQKTNASHTHDINGDSTPSQSKRRTDDIINELAQSSDETELDKYRRLRELRECGTSTCFGLERRGACHRPREDNDEGAPIWARGPPWQPVGVSGPRPPPKECLLPETSSQLVGWHGCSTPRTRGGNGRLGLRGKPPTDATGFAYNYRKYALAHPFDNPPFSSGNFLL